MKHECGVNYLLSFQVLILDTHVFLLVKKLLELSLLLPSALESTKTVLLEPLLSLIV